MCARLGLQNNYHVKVKIQIKSLKVIVWGT